MPKKTVLINKLLNKWNIKGIIFDLDGTIVDTLDQHILAFVKTFETLPISVEEEEIKNQMGRTPKDIIQEFVPDIEKQPKKLQNLADLKEEHLSSYIENVKLLPGAKKLVSHLSKLNFPLAIASSTPRDNFTKILTGTNLNQYFNATVTGEEISLGKPHPAVFELAAKKLGLKSIYCLIIGDSIHDVIAAKKAKMKVIAVSSGKHTKKQLQTMEPDYLIQSLNELVATI